MFPFLLALLFILKIRLGVQSNILKIQNKQLLVSPRNGYHFCVFHIKLHTL